MKHRMMLLGLGFTVIILCYTLRLFYLQVTPVQLNLYSAKNSNDAWTRNAIKQRTKTLQLADGRAIFVDQNKTPLHTEFYHTIIFYPIEEWKSDISTRKQLLNTLFHSEVKDFLAWLEQLEEPSFLYDRDHYPIMLTDDQLHQLKSLDPNGFTVVPYTLRNGHHHFYPHLIGYVAENAQWVEAHYEQQIKKNAAWHRNMKIGVLGLERSLDRYLHGGARYITYTLDGKDRYLQGLGTKTIGDSKYYPLTVITTLDKELQTNLEQLMDEAEIEEGAIVVLDSSTADVYAMVSKPDLVPEALTTMNSPAWKNNAITAFEPGSIYKIITTAAALEFGVVDEHETFHCDGEYGKYGLSCWKKGGHGSQTLAEAFANSCNITFATIAERLEPYQLQQTAEALGVIHPVGWHEDHLLPPLKQPLRLLLEEERGVALLQQKKDGGIMAQSGIGQRDVKLTPLQAANMLVTIVNYGKQFETRVVSEVAYADGIPLVSFPIHQGHEHQYQIHPATARKLMHYMEMVVREGTAKQINNRQYSYAGKTGTAQLSGEWKGYNNQWFIGYGPTEAPKYAVAILIRKVKANTPNRALSIFDRTMRLLMDQNNKAHD